MITNNTETGIKCSEWNYRFAGILGGFLLVAGNFYAPLALLQLIAFLPLMIVMLKYNGTKANATVCGIYMSLTYILPQMAYLRMPVIITVILLIYMSIMLITLCFLVGVTINKTVIQAGVLSGIAMYAIDYLNCTLLPIWGLAQSFVRSWSSYPYLIGFISITGICGVIFVIGSIQALMAHFVVFPDSRKKSVMLISFILLICGLCNYLTHPDIDGTLKVATIGWVLDENDESSNPSSEYGFQKLFLEPAQMAANQGARLITTGELGFYFNKLTYEKEIAVFKDFATQNNLWLSIGVFDISSKENKVLFISPEGDVVEEYVKTYLTPLEQGKKGHGHLKSIKIDGFDIGTMICQDDNFQQQTNIYGRNGTGLIICPTADWDTVRVAHLQAVRARAIECRYSIVRAAANGISAIISPEGKIIESMDHYKQGPGYLIADVPICTDKTIFSRYEFSLPMAFGILTIIVMNKRSH